MAARLGSLAGLLALAGCCLTIVPGIGNEPETSGQSTGSGVGSTGGGVSASAGPGSTGNGTTGATSGASSGTGTASGAGTTGGPTGTTDGTSGGAVPLLPTFLVDAGPGEILGPVSIASGSNHTGDPGARLVYSRGEGGQFQILFVSFSADGNALIGPELVATTGVISALPEVAVSDFGTNTAI